MVSGNLSKNSYVCATQWSASCKLKIKFYPSLDRSWCEFFEIIKNHGPKNPPQGCILGPSFHSHAGHLQEKKNDNLAVQYEDVHDLTHVGITHIVNVEETHDLWYWEWFLRVKYQCAFENLNSRHLCEIWTLKFDFWFFAYSFQQSRIFSIDCSNSES